MNWYPESIIGFVFLVVIILGIWYYLDYKEGERKRKEDDGKKIKNRLESLGYGG